MYGQTRSIVPQQADPMFNRFPCVRQHDQSDCGAAALATVLKYYRRPAGLQQVREHAGTDAAGTNLAGLIHAATRCGLQAIGVKGPYDALLGARLPAIAHVRNQDGLGHFVVLFRVTKKRVILVDPASGSRTVDRKTFCEEWTGVLLLIEPDQTGIATRNLHHTSEPETKKIRRSTTRLAEILFSHIGILSECVVCALLMTLLGLCTSMFVQQLVDSVLVQAHTGLLNALGIGMMCIVIFKAVFGVLRGYLLAHLSRRIDLALMSGYLTHVVRLPMRFFESRRIGEIVSRSNDAARIRDAVSGAALTIVLDGLMLLIASAVLWFYDAQLAAVACVFVPILLASVLAHHPAARSRSRQAMEGAARYSAHAIEDISGVATIKSLGVERLRKTQRDARLLDLIGTLFSVRKLGISMSALSSLITGAAGIVVLWYGGHRVIEGALTIGQLMFFYTMLGHLLGPLERLASVNLQIQDALVAAERLFEVIDLEAESLSDPNKSQLIEFKHGIHFDDVRFRYGCREEVLKGVKLKIPAGATVGIVGESGSGKSTLLKMLMRFYEPDSGRLTIDGMDARDIRTDSIRAATSMVSQDAFIFSGTIRENIGLGCENPTLDKIAIAARTAGLEDYIESLPERYETVIGEQGANLSGGQRQRVAIARALLSDAPILLLDEATSHLDTTTEQEIQRNLRTSCFNKTVVAVAHRLSTVRDADVIYVMDEGRVVESGSHSELLAVNGRYASLWRAQTGQNPASKALTGPPAHPLPARNPLLDAFHAGSV